MMAFSVKSFAFLICSKETCCDRGDTPVPSLFFPGDFGTLGFVGARPPSRPPIPPPPRPCGCFRRGRGEDPGGLSEAFFCGEEEASLILLGDVLAADARWPLWLCDLSSGAGFEGVLEELTTAELTRGAMGALRLVIVSHFVHDIFDKTFLGNFDCGILFAINEDEAAFDFSFPSDVLEAEEVVVLTEFSYFV